jgi:hypothetical protein
MSTSKKKVVPKVPVITPNYKLGQKVYYIFHRDEAEEILEAEITVVRTFQAPIKDESGKTVRVDTCFKYDVNTRRGWFRIPEYDLYPNFVEVAKEFAKGFLFLLK